MERLARRRIWGFLLFGFGVFLAIVSRLTADENYDTSGAGGIDTFFAILAGLIGLILVWSSFQTEGVLSYKLKMVLILLAIAGVLGIGAAFLVAAFTG